MDDVVASWRKEFTYPIDEHDACLGEFLPEIPMRNFLGVLANDFDCKVQPLWFVYFFL